MFERIRPNVRNKLLAAAAAGALLLSACGESQPAPPAPLQPHRGIVTDKSSEDYYAGCGLSINGICYDYESYTDYYATIAACRPKDGQVVVADEAYLQGHVDAPSDYPMHVEGVLPSTDDAPNGIACSAKLPVDEDVYNAIKLDQLITIG